MYGVELVGDVLRCSPRLTVDTAASEIDTLQRAERSDHGAVRRVVGRATRVMAAAAKAAPAVRTMAGPLAMFW